MSWAARRSTQAFQRITAQEPIDISSSVAATARPTPSVAAQ